MLNNVRGFKSKETLIKRIIQEEEPVFIALVETKLNGEEIDIEGYEKPLRVDRIGDGGGVMVAYKKCLKNIVVCTSEIRKHLAEMIWLRIDNGEVKLKIGVIYMPQESRTTLEKLKEIYQIIEKEVIDAQEKGDNILILGDLNCKVGGAIEGNSEEITKGGRLLLKLLRKYKMKIVNAEKCCDGIWTRIEGEKRSVLDYVLVFEEDIALVNKMEIDEEKDITPYHVEISDGKPERKYTDHAMITAYMNLKFKVEKGKTYAMVMDQDGVTRYRERLAEENISSLINEDDIRTTYPKWRDKVTEIRESCCKKVKIRKKWKVCRKLTVMKKEITKELKKKLSAKRVKELKDRRKLIQQQIDDEERLKEYTRINKIVDEVRKSGGVNSTMFWEVRKRIQGKREDPAYAMENKWGKMCDKPEEIKEIHKDWFKELLTMAPGKTELERQAEEVVDMAWRSMLEIAKNQPPQVTTREEVEDVVNKLKKKKAKDATSWRNEHITEGGEEMIVSLKKIVNQVDRQKEIPSDWEKMEIKATHKTGQKCHMKNKRGLFLTNNVSKVYERVMKGRNDKSFRKGITDWATGGVSERAPVDNVLTATSVLEQNKYLKQNTYLVFTDAEKCFDKLWLKDGIYELWRCGTDVRDCVMIKRLNEKAEIVVKTPVGNTEPFVLSDIVRQGSVYGPQICIASMDKINRIGKDARTYYSPEVPLESVVFVDDVTGIGGIGASNRLMFNCNIMEEKKKMTFSNKRGKTEYVVVGNYEEIRTVSGRVKKGIIQKVEEHKMLGTWVDETGTYGINIGKRGEKLQYMISTVKRQASPKTVGVYSVEARLKLAEVTVIVSILNNAEAFHEYKECEIRRLESIQLNILTGILELPRTTPYCALLMEVGWWTMRTRLAYKKMMLYHNIIRSDQKRPVKRILQVQEKEERETSWWSSVQRELKKYEIKLDAKETLKSTWKREVKKMINLKMEEEIRERCRNSKKARTVKDDKFETKEYLLGKVSLNEAKNILMTRMNMVKIPGNYKSNGGGNCTLCEEEEGSTEHYFECCKVKQLTKAWNVSVSDLSSQNINKMKDVANFMEKVQVMLNP